MEVIKRKVNGISSNNRHEKKKKIKKNYEEQDLEALYFESEITYHSTVTKMKINALLNEVTLKENQCDEINQFIETISNEIKSIPQGKIRDLSKMSDWLEKFDIKIPLSFSKMTKNFQFLPPKMIQTIGSYTSNTLIIKSSNKISTIIDLLVEIPHICIHKKDYLNNEYIEKRAIYLCYLAKKLKYSLEFSHLNDTTLNQTVLLVKPNDTSSFAIRILLGPEQDYFNEKRLAPSSSNLRWKWFNNKEKEEEEEIEPFYPTPNYNSLILLDCRYRATSNYLQKIFLSSNELCNGLKLFKIWLEQRQLSFGFGSFEGAMPAFFLAYLLHTNKINKQMFSYQVFRIILVALTENNFQSSENCSLTNEKILENLFTQDDCVLIDQSGLLNVFHTLTRANYNRLKYEANISLNIFNDPVIDHFQILFMTSMQSIYTMDAVIEISSIDQYEKLLEEKSNRNQLIMDNLNNKHYLLAREILHLLEYGLKERIQLLCPLPSINQTTKTWSINQSIPPRTSITFGIIFSDQYDLSILKGPESGTKEAELFRKLWSERCELRRFPDGSILESVVWNVDSAKDKRLIWLDATRYLLEIKAGISPNHIEFIHNDQLLSSLLSIPVRLFPSYGTGDEQQIYLCREFVELSKQIRLLNNDFPLKINNIIGLDETFRYTNVFPSLPSSFQTDLNKIRSIEHDTYALIPRSTSRYAPPYSQSLFILCQLEMTNSNDENFETLERIKHSKILYYIQLAKLLKEKYNLICHATIDSCYIEKNNYIYRLIISYHKEIYLIESQAGINNGLERTIKQTNLSKKLRYQTEILPKIHAAIYGVSQQFIHYQLVARLFKRWLSSQLLLYHFDPINVDLLCCYIFLHSTPSKSILTSFYRVLRLLRDFDWINEPLIINFNHQLTKEQIFEMLQHFKTERANLPALSLMPSIAFYENKKPTVPILKRVIQLAKQALNHLETNNSDSIKFLFRPSINAYDVIIMLDPLQCPRAYQAIDHITTEVTYTTRKKSIDENKKLLSIVDYDPAQLFLDELRTSFNDQAEFFHDEFGGLIICVLWKPSTTNNNKFDYVKIIEQWKLLGTGIIKEIRTFPERWC